MARSNAGSVLLSFDVEEFDLPKERGGEISLARGVEISAGGLERILEVLKRCKVKATFFVTGNFASRREDLVKKILAEGHEVGCHGVDHFRPKATDARESKKILEKTIGSEVLGYRQPRMFKIDYQELNKCGYIYDSSVNPALIPGRYNHLDVPRRPYDADGVIEVPTAVATFLRVPLFWLALHVFPVSFYSWLARLSLKETGYLATYFHPWEFADELKDFKVVPWYIKKNGGRKMAERLERVILDLKKRGYEFTTYNEFVKTKQ